MKSSAATLETRFGSRHLRTRYTKINPESSWGNLKPSREEPSHGICLCQLIRTNAVDPICIQHVRQRHDAFQLMNIRSVDDWQDIQMVFAHAFERVM